MTWSPGTATETRASPGARNRTAGSNPATKRQTRIPPRASPARNTEPASAYQPSPGMRGTALTSAGVALEERDHFAVAALFCHPDGEMVALLKRYTR